TSSPSSTAPRAAASANAMARYTVPLPPSPSASHRRYPPARNAAWHCGQTALSGGLNAPQALHGIIIAGGAVLLSFFRSRPLLQDVVLLPDGEAQATVEVDQFRPVNAAVAHAEAVEIGRARGHQPQPQAPAAHCGADPQRADAAPRARLQQRIID